MGDLIKNRAFDLPQSPNASIPTNWTKTQNSPSWGGPTWASGVYRSVKSGSFPFRGNRCLLIGAADATTATTSAELADADECYFSQVVSGRAFSNVSHISVKYLCANQGGDPSHSQVFLSVSDGSTTVTDTDLLSTSTVFSTYSLIVALSTLNQNLNWTIKIGLERTAASSEGGNVQIPRVYFDDVRVHWTAYTATPLRVLRYSDDLAPSSTITGTTAATGFALANVANRRASHPYVSSSTASAYIEIDFGSAQTVNICGLIDCNFASSDSWTLTGGASANPTTVSYSFACNDSKNSFVEFSPVAYRYWRLTMTATAAKQFRVGEIAIGDAIHMQQNFTWGPSPSVGYQTTKHTTPYGAEWAYEKGYRRSYSLAYGPMESCDVDDLRDVFEDAAGDVYPILLIPKPDHYACYYGTLQQSWSEVERFINVGVPGSLSFAEQAHSLVQT